MKPTFHVVYVYEDEVTAFDLPVEVNGYDEKTNQSYNGKVVYSQGQVKLIDIKTQFNLPLSGYIRTQMTAFMRSFKDQYESKH